MKRQYRVKTGIVVPSRLSDRLAAVCTKCGTSSLVTEASVKNRMVWCSPCRQKQPSHWPEFNAWKAMILRCTDATDKRWKDYGGRGIKVCERWLNSYEDFLADMGRRPSGEHSIDRIDNDGDYKPENCRWATRQEQYANMRKNKFIVVEGRRMHLSAAARMLGLKVGTLMARLDRGWSAEEAIRPLKRVTRDEMGRTKWD